MKTTYQIRTETRTHGATSLAAARMMARSILGRDRLVSSHWYTVDDGEAISVYPTRAEHDADQDGSRGMRITRTVR